jgi:hypothetical protein
LEVQTSWQRRSPPHFGVAGGQFAFERQPTHLPSATKHNGAAVPHCASAVHATHWPLAVLQNGRGVPAHSASIRQPTHAPVAESQIAAPSGHIPLTHAPWHV